VAITPTRQRNSVSQGIGLGLLLQGISELPADKVKLDLAITRAWRNWEFKDRFPQVATDLRKGMDGVRVLTRAGERRQGFLLWWTVDESAWVMVLRQPDWDPTDEGDLDFALEMLDGDVSAEGWRSLARGMLDALDLKPDATSET
jgi:hypothetical protein